MKCNVNLPTLRAKVVIVTRLSSNLHYLITMFPLICTENVYIEHENSKTGAVMLVSGQASGFNINIYIHRKTLITLDLTKPYNT